MTPLSPEVFQSLLAIGWIDGDLHPSEAAAVLAAAVEQAGLHAVATLMGISATGRQTMDEVVDGLRKEGHARLDLVGLRARIDAAIRAALG